MLVSSAAFAADGSMFWWRAFDDPLLDSLIQTGRDNNYNISAAARRIDAARASLNRSRGAYAPSIGLSAGWTASKSSGRVSEVPSAETRFFSAGATMSWEIDVFGKIRRQVKQAGAELKLTKAEYDAALLALEAQIATSYFNLLVHRQQLEVARNHAANQKHIVEITETRHRTGLASKLDVAQANTLYYSTTAMIPQLEATIEADYNALATLLATERDSLPSGIMGPPRMPSFVGIAPDQAPLQVIEQRPDIIEAARAVDVAAASLGIERSQYLPSLAVQAQIGTEAHRFGDLFGSHSLTYSVTPTLSWTLFDGFGRHYATVAAREQMRAQIENYNMAVISAIEEARNAICGYKADILYIQSIEKVVEASRESVDLSLDLYKQGLSQFSNVVDAQLNLLTYQNTLVEAHGDALSSLVNIYKALGGNYQQ